jgi:hypothetical protein
LNADTAQSVAGIAGALAVAASMMGRAFPWRIRLTRLLAVLWIVLLLSLFGYAVVRGEDAVEEFRELKIATDF